MYEAHDEPGLESFHAIAVAVAQLQHRLASKEFTPELTFSPWTLEFNDVSLERKFTAAAQFVTDDLVGTFSVPASPGQDFGEAEAAAELAQQQASCRCCGVCRRAGLLHRGTIIRWAVFIGVFATTQALGAQVLKVGNSTSELEQQLTYAAVSAYTLSCLLLLAYQAMTQIWFKLYRGRLPTWTDRWEPCRRYNVRRAMTLHSLPTPAPKWPARLIVLSFPLLPLLLEAAIGGKYGGLSFQITVLSCYMGIYFVNARFKEVVPTTATGCTIYFIVAFWLADPGVVSQAHLLLIAAVTLVYLVLFGVHKYQRERAQRIAFAQTKQRMRLEAAFTQLSALQSKLLRLQLPAFVLQRLDAVGVEAFEAMCSVVFMTLHIVRDGTASSSDASGSEASSSSNTELRLLNNAFAKADRLAPPNGVHKLKTVGRSWIGAVGDLEKPGSMSAEESVLEALRFAQLLQQALAEEGWTRCTAAIGISTDKIVAGALGAHFDAESSSLTQFEFVGDCVYESQLLASTKLDGIFVAESAYKQLRSKYRHRGWELSSARPMPRIQHHGYMSSHFKQLQRLAQSHNGAVAGRSEPEASAEASEKHTPALLGRTPSVSATLMNLGGATEVSLMRSMSSIARSGSQLNATANPLTHTDKLINLGIRAMRAAASVPTAASLGSRTATSIDMESMAASSVDDCVQARLSRTTSRSTQGEQRRQCEQCTDRAMAWCGLRGMADLQKANPEAARAARAANRAPPHVLPLLLFTDVPLFLTYQYRLWEELLQPGRSEAVWGLAIVVACFLGSVVLWLGAWKPHAGPAWVQRASAWTRRRRTVLTIILWAALFLSTIITEAAIESEPNNVCGRSFHSTVWMVVQVASFVLNMTALPLVVAACIALAVAVLWLLVLFGLYAWYTRHGDQPWQDADGLPANCNPPTNPAFVAIPLTFFVMYFVFTRMNQELVLLKLYLERQRVMQTLRHARRQSRGLSAAIRTILPPHALRLMQMRVAASTRGCEHRDEPYSSKPPSSRWVQRCCWCLGARCGGCLTECSPSSAGRRSHVCLSPDAPAISHGIQLDESEGSTGSSMSVLWERQPRSVLLLVNLLVVRSVSGLLMPADMFSLLQTLVYALDVVVAKRGGWRARLSGDKYLAVFSDTDDVRGAESYACRAMIAANNMFRALESMGKELRLQLDAAITLHAGPMTCGMLGLSAATYDAHGQTVDVLEELSMSPAAQSPGNLCVSGAAAQLLCAQAPAAIGLFSMRHSVRTTMKIKSFVHILRWCPAAAGALQVCFGQAPLTSSQVAAVTGNAALAYVASVSPAVLDIILRAALVYLDLHAHGGIACMPLTPGAGTACASDATFRSLWERECPRAFSTKALHGWVRTSGRVKWARTLNQVLNQPAAQPPRASFAGQDIAPVPVQAVVNAQVQTLGYVWLEVSMLRVGGTLLMFAHKLHNKLARGLADRSAGSSPSVRSQRTHSSSPVGGLASSGNIAKSSRGITPRSSGSSSRGRRHASRKTRPALRQRHFKRLQPLGSGRFASVYLCVHLESKNFFAVKCLPAKSSSTSLQAELKALTAPSSHPCVVEYIACVSSSQEIWLVMEYIQGVSLKSLVAEGRRMPWSSALFLVRQLVAAVGYLHSLGILHRDIKPENTMVTPQGQLKLIDMGLATLLSTTTQSRASAPQLPAQEQTASQLPSQSSALSLLQSIVPSADSHIVSRLMRPRPQLPAVPAALRGPMLQPRVLLPELRDDQSVFTALLVTMPYSSSQSSAQSLSAAFAAQNTASLLCQQGFAVVTRSTLPSLNKYLLQHASIVDVVVIQVLDHFDDAVDAVSMVNRHRSVAVSLHVTVPNPQLNQADVQQAVCQLQQRIVNRHVYARATTSRFKQVDAVSLRVALEGLEGQMRDGAPVMWADSGSTSSMSDSCSERVANAAHRASQGTGSSSGTGPSTISDDVSNELSSGLLAQDLNGALGQASALGEEPRATSSGMHSDRLADVQHGLMPASSPSGSPFSSGSALVSMDQSAPAAAAANGAAAATAAGAGAGAAVRPSSDKLGRLVRRGLSSASSGSRPPGSSTPRTTSPYYPTSPSAPAEAELQQQDGHAPLDMGEAMPASSMMRAPVQLVPAKAATTVAGTPMYTAKEVFQRNASFPSDWWSVGVLIFRLLTGCYPFDASSTAEVREAVMKHNINWACLPADVPAEAESLLRALLHSDAEARLGAVGGAAEVLRHPALACPPGVPTDLPTTPLQILTPQGQTLAYKDGVLAPVRGDTTGAPAPATGWLDTGLRRRVQLTRSAGEPFSGLGQAAVLARPPLMPRGGGAGHAPPAPRTPRLSDRALASTDGYRSHVPVDSLRHAAQPLGQQAGSANGAAAEQAGTASAATSASSAASKRAALLAAHRARLAAVLPEDTVSRWSEAVSQSFKTTASSAGTPTAGMPGPDFSAPVPHATASAGQAGGQGLAVRSDGVSPQACAMTDQRRAALLAQHLARLRQVVPTSVAQRWQQSASRIQGGSAQADEEDVPDARVMSAGPRAGPLASFSITLRSINEEATPSVSHSPTDLASSSQLEGMSTSFVPASTDGGAGAA